MRLFRAEPFLLLVGDLVVFYVALWLTLVVRDLGIPGMERWVDHAAPFTLLFGISVLIYFIVGLYDRHTSYLRSRLPALVAYGQIATVIVAALFFLSTPYFGITPKTILFIFLAISSALVVFWRLVLTRFLGVRQRQNALVFGSGEEMEELIGELNGNDRYGLVVKHRFAPSEVEVSEQLQEQLLHFIERKGITTIVVDTRDPEMARVTPAFYDLLFMHPDLTILDALTLYEDIFRRIPISMLEHAWFIEHMTLQTRPLYDLYHRVFDIVISIPLGLVTLVVFPFVAAAIKFEDRGPLFSLQRRVGKDGVPVELIKFRTMTVANDNGAWGSVPNEVTRVGAFLRKTRIDELPQLWNVLVGGYSLIGPRPEFAEAVAQYRKAIPYYNARHLITPGLSGWAQLNHHEHPHHDVDIIETRKKLSYDLYYLKHRSFWLDIEIGLKTIKTLVSAVGK